MRITEWDVAYANRDHVADAGRIIERWPVEAQAYRGSLGARAELDIAYGEDPRQRLDLFRPEGTPDGLMVFVHGGYWRLFDKSYWSHFARGAVECGWAVAVVEYRLAPGVAISDITRDVAAAVNCAAGHVDGPIALTGHSAGGHLVARVACDDTTVSDDVLNRITHIVPISGINDLRPITRTDMNRDFGLDDAGARAESPALLTPREGVRVTAWVGGAELPELVRQTTLLANIWTGLGADMAQVITPRRHHFDVIEDLSESRSALVETILSQG